MESSGATAATTTSSTMLNNKQQQDIIDGLRLQLSFHQTASRKILPDSNQTQQLQIHFLERRVQELQSQLTQQDKRHKEEYERLYEEVQVQLDARVEHQKLLQQQQSLNQVLVDELCSYGKMHSSVCSMQIATVVVMENYWRERIEKEAQRYFLLRHVESLADACATMTMMSGGGGDNASAFSTSFKKASDVIENVTVSTGDVIEMFSERNSPANMHNQYRSFESLSSQAMGLVQMARPFNLQLRFAKKGVLVDDDLRNVRAALPPPRKLVSRGVSACFDDAPLVGISNATNNNSMSAHDDVSATASQVGEISATQEEEPRSLVASSAGASRVPTPAPAGVQKSTDNNQVEDEELEDAATTLSSVAPSSVLPAKNLGGKQLTAAEVDDTNVKLRRALEEMNAMKREVAKEKKQRALLEEEKVRWLMERSRFVKEQMAQDPEGTEAGDISAFRSASAAGNFSAAGSAVGSVRGVSAMPIDAAQQNRAASRSMEPDVMKGVPLHEVSPHGGFFVHQHQRPPASVAAWRTSSPQRGGSNIDPSIPPQQQQQRSISFHEDATSKSKKHRNATVASDAEVDDALERLEFVTKDLMNIESIARQTPEGGMRRRLLRELDDVHRVKSSDVLANAKKMLAQSKPQY